MCLQYKMQPCPSPFLFISDCKITMYVFHFLVPFISPYFTLNSDIGHLIPLYNEKLPHTLYSPFQKPNNEIRYSITGQGNAATFFVVNELTGALYIQRPLSQDDPETSTYVVSTRLLRN